MIQNSASDDRCRIVNFSGFNRKLALARTAARLKSHAVAERAVDTGVEKRDFLESVRVAAVGHASVLRLGINMDADSPFV
jgi:hypothetical protein